MSIWKKLREDWLKMDKAEDDRILKDQEFLARPRLSATPPPGFVRPINDRKVLAIVKELQKARGEWMVSDFTIADRILSALDELEAPNG